MSDEQNPAFLTSIRSHFVDLPRKIKEMFETDECDQCCGEDQFRFITSMVCHQLPFQDTSDQLAESDMIVSLVAHMLWDVVGNIDTCDQSVLRQEYIEYVEGYISEDVNEETDFSFITSFVSHCLPFMDISTQPIFSELLSSMASHRAGETREHQNEEDNIISPKQQIIKDELVSAHMTPISSSPESRYSTDSSSLDRKEIELWARASDMSTDGSLSDKGVFDSESSSSSSKRNFEKTQMKMYRNQCRNRVAAVDQIKSKHDSDKQSSNGSGNTPESLKSLEPILSYPNRHLLSNFSDIQLDRNFSGSSGSSAGVGETPGISLSPHSDNGYRMSGSSPSEDGYNGSKEQSASPTVRIDFSQSDISDTWLVEEKDLIITEMEEDEYDELEFEARELSIVLEETEETEESSDDTNTEMEQVVTATCTFGVDTPIRIQTVVETEKVDGGKETKNIVSEAEMGKLIKKKKKFDKATKPDTKHVTFVDEAPTIINFDSDSQESQEDVKIAPQLNVDKASTSQEKKPSTEDVKNVSPCKKCKKPQTPRVRFNVQVGSTQPKERKSLFDVVVGWFGKFM